MNRDNAALWISIGILLLSCVFSTIMGMLELADTKQNRAVCAAYCLPAESVDASSTYCVCKAADGALTAKERP